MNNMLAGMLGHLYLIGEHSKGDPVLLKGINTINRLGMSAAEMVKQLLTFARKDRLEMQPFSLSKLLHDCKQLTAIAIPENINHHCDIPSQEYFVYGDSNQLQQVLMNLITNARDALETTKHGEITCSLTPYQPDFSFKQRHPDCQGDHFVCLMVQDNGSGISIADQEQVFDPFFTTKDVGKGTGLGLAMVYGAIKSHQGAIEMNSSPDRGATFNIYLPLITEAPCEQINRRKEQVKKGNNELILIADDDIEVRDVYERLLVSLGYQVLVAKHGEEAVRLFEQHSSAISLALLDVVMPVMGGMDAAKLIRQTAPALPIIFSTGYEKATVLKEKDVISNVLVVSKPVSVNALSSAIRTLIK